MTGSDPFGPKGCGLPEVIVALTVLSIGLLAIAGLVRAVSHQAEHARAQSDTALLAQQQLEAVLLERAPAPSSHARRLRFGNREYAVEITLEAVMPALQRIRIDLVRDGPPGFGLAPPHVRSYTTRRQSAMPRLAPPSYAIP